jgi:hypothetical protein
MKYILSQKEYDALRAEQTEKIKLSRDKLQKLCTKIANEMPVVWGWNGDDPKPWGCIITAEDKGDEWYCDQCPVQEICPSPRKEYSK